jgi:hypothetical protein
MHLDPNTLRNLGLALSLLGALLVWVVALLLLLEVTQKLLDVLHYVVELAQLS